MKNVWILNHYAQAPGGVGGVRHFSLAESLAAEDWSATVIAASVAHATGRQHLRGLSLRRLRDVSGVPWLLIRTPAYKGNGISRIINMLVYTIMTLIPGMLRGLARPDVIIGSSVHPLAAWAGSVLAKRYRVPFVFEVRDLWPATLVDMERLSPNSLMTRLLYRLERRLSTKAAMIIVLLPRAAEYYQALGVDREKVMVLQNGAYVDEKAPVLPPERDQFVLMYCGAMGEANALQTLIDSLCQVEKRWNVNKQFKCRLVGAGPEKDALERRAHELGLKSLSFEMPVPKNQVADLLAEADAFVITLRDLPNLYRFGISMNKIFDYMSAGRPIVMAADVPDNPVAMANGGVVVNPESPDELAEAILTLANKPREESEAMGKNAWQYALDNHHYMNLARQLAGRLNSVVSNSDKAIK